ncbi:hypothetical protein B0J13DRAFT_627398 [Dactylonectria estremocensis]|uniref:Rhodopsin domain-containing protein n=1 Tax=Dactylonectria estremocensis TaxID=1079267 RepID=A0A9P9E047_9HYPO|nr:hypothetical protein B0J13DRAFT_627398 [Dactylonectria estremocensis]
MALPAPGPVPVLVTEWVILGVAALSISARLHLRLLIQKRRLLTSDWLICGAWVMAAANASFDIALAQLGALEPGVTTTLRGYNGSLEDAELSLKLYWISYFPYFATFYLSKGSLLAVYMHFFTDSMVKRKMIADPATSCEGEKMVRVFEGAWAMHFSSDMLVFILPWFILPDLKLEKAMKIGVICTLLLGMIDIIFCLVRFITIQISIRGDTLSLSLNELWSSLDSNIGVLVASLPGLRPYFRRNKAKSSSCEATTASTNR